MNTSEQINELATALAEAQADMINPEKTKTAKIKSDKGSFEYKYADLADTLDGLRKTLAAHSLAFVQVTQLDGDAVTLLTRLMHGSGQWIESVYPVCRTGAHQQMGAALTYARRYSLFSLVGIAGEDDTDGNGAADAIAAPKRQAPAPRPQVPEQSSEDLVRFMLAACNGMDDLGKLNEWATRHKAAFARLSTDQQVLVRDVFDNKRGLLAQAPPPVAHDPKTGEVEDDGPETDGLMVNYAAKIEDWSDRLRAATSDERAEMWETEIAPRVEAKVIFPPDALRLKAMAEKE